MAIYSRGRARRSLLDTVTYRGISQAATVLSYIAMVRGMTEHDFGVLNLLYAFIPVVGTLTSFGLEQTLRRFQPEYLRAGNPLAAAWLVRFVASSRFATSVVLLGLVVLLWHLVAPFFKIEPYRGEFALFGVFIVLFFQSRILQLTLSAHMLHRFSVGSMSVLSLSKLVAYGVLFWLDRFTLINAIVAESLCQGLTYAFLKWAHHRYCVSQQSPRGVRPNREECRRMLRYGFFNNFNDAGTMVLNTRTDNFFIAALVDPIAVGAYSFYIRMSEMVAHLLPISLFESVVQPLFFAIEPDKAGRRIPAYFSLLVNANLMLQLPVMAYAVAYHREIVDILFSGKFAESSWLLPVVLGFATLNIISTPVTLVAQYEEKASIILLSKVFAIYNILAILALLPLAGLYGAAVATGSAQLLKNLFIWWHVRRRARWLNFRSVISMTLLIWGSAVFVCYAFKAFFSWHPLAQVAIGVLVCGLAWLLYLRSPAISESDREILASVLRGREASGLRWLGLLPRQTT